MKAVARTIAQVAVIALSAVPFVWVAHGVVDAHRHPSTSSPIHAPDPKR
jgi:hypothetical protein